MTRLSVSSVYQLDLDLCRSRDVKIIYFLVYQSWVLQYTFSLIPKAGNNIKSKIIRIIISSFYYAVYQRKRF